MKNKIVIVFIIGVFFGACGPKPAFALEHTQKGGLFSMDIPSDWHWDNYPQEVIITYSDGKTIAMDIQMVPIDHKLGPAEIKKILKQDNDRMIKDGIKAHNGIFLAEKEISLDGVYATQLDFKTVSPNLLHVTYIAFYNKGHAFTITYGSGDDKIRSVMDDAVATFKFK